MADLRIRWALAALLTTLVGVMAQCVIFGPSLLPWLLRIGYHPVLISFGLQLQIVAWNAVAGAFLVVFARRNKASIQAALICMALLSIQFLPWIAAVAAIKSIPNPAERTIAADESRGCKGVRCQKGQN